MPTSTFFNLPEEKRGKLLAAAREEFMRLPFPEVSINKIIHTAQIPRGSFYMYFKDKRDLFAYLLQTYSDRLSALLEQILAQAGGDVFSAFLALFDHLVQQRRAPEEDGSFSALLDIIRHNMAMLSDGILAFLNQADCFPAFFRQIDRTLLHLEREEDLPDMIHILFSVSGRPLLMAMLSEAPQEARARYSNVLDILRRGLGSR